jgi:Prokaryotic phospholipase A2
MPIKTMPIKFRVVTAAAAMMLLLVPSASALNFVPYSMATVQQRASWHMFGESVPTFIAKKYGSKDNLDSRFDWSDNGCSGPTPFDNLFYAKFANPCKRHDFGYRNSRPIGVGATWKGDIDATFYNDMIVWCNSNNTRYLPAWSLCVLRAGTFYSAVRTFGRI